MHLHERTHVRGCSVLQRVAACCSVLQRRVVMSRTEPNEPYHTRYICVMYVICIAYNIFILACLYEPYHHTDASCSV